MDIRPIVEAYAGHKIGVWFDTSELHYYARKIGYAKLEEYLL